jgi:poly(hydroxyalkanoate) depolymerase family esterase
MALRYVKVTLREEMAFSKSIMIEVARLTREGRLAEATTLIRSSLGLSSAPQKSPARVVESPTIEAKSSSVSEPPPDVPPEAGPHGAGQTPAQSETGHFKTMQPGISPPLSPLDLTSFSGLPKAEFPGKLPARGPSIRHFPNEVIFPPRGQWVAGTHSGEAGMRGYKLYLPSGYQGQPRPLIVMLHGCTQSADDFAAGTRMNFLAEQEGLLVVYPEQAAVANRSRCWNWFQPTDQRRDHGEPALIVGITRQIMAKHKVEANRVYIAGLSAGGAMAAIVAGEYPDLYTAVGVHSGLVPGSAHDLPSALHAMQRGYRGGGSGVVPGKAIPLILFHGDKDTTVHPRNADEFIRLWVRAGPSRETLSEGQAPGGRSYSCSVYHEPSGRTLVERWIIHGANHAWSGGSPHGTFTDPTGPDASRELVRFFREHPRTTE